MKIPMLYVLFFFCFIARCPFIPFHLRIYFIPPYLVLLSKRVSLGISVRLLPCELDVTGSNPRNNLSALVHWTAFFTVLSVVLLPFYLDN